MAQIGEKLNKEFNDQVREELDSAYIYLAMSAWFAERTLNNLANWFNKQAGEEYEHAMKFVNYILETGGSVNYEALKEPKRDYENILEIIEAAYEHEKYITKRIHHLYQVAQEEKELSAYPLLLWFLEEQVEEEDQTAALIDKYKGYKNDFNFDHHVKRD
ncbi:MAG: ferritin [Asgard group archaeon]|nr:ferritin [Asgard group archaeon]